MGPAEAARNVVVLKEPITLGSEVIERLELKFSARSFKEFQIPLREDGTILFQPYPLAVAGVRMAGQPAILIDKLGPADFFALAQAVMSFLS